MKRVLLLILSSICLSVAPLSAEESGELQSEKSVETGTPSFRPAQLIAPGILAGSGLAVHYLSHDPGLDRTIQQYFYGNLRQSGAVAEFPVDNYIQYVPLAATIGLGLTGVKAKHCFVDRLIETALAHASLGILSGGGKLLFHTLRPNEGNYQSFPSGHTSFTFTGAELVRIEYGNGWGAGAYGIAGTVGVLRLYNNWHWFSDVLFGAGIGILSAHIGEWLLEPFKNLFGIRVPEGLQFGVVPSVDPVSGTPCALFAWNF